MSISKCAKRDDAETVLLSAGSHAYRKKKEGERQVWWRQGQSTMEDHLNPQPMRTSTKDDLTGRRKRKTTETENGL